MENEHLHSFLETITDRTPVERLEAIMCETLEQNNGSAPHNADPSFPYQIELHGITSNGKTLIAAVEN